VPAQFSEARFMCARRARPSIPDEAILRTRGDAEMCAPRVARPPDAFHALPFLPRAAFMQRAAKSATPLMRCFMRQMRHFIHYARDATLLPSLPRERRKEARMQHAAEMRDASERAIYAASAPTRESVQRQARCRCAVLRCAAPLCATRHFSPRLRGERATRFSAASDAPLRGLCAATMRLRAIVMRRRRAAAAFIFAAASCRFSPLFRLPLRLYA